MVSSAQLNDLVIVRRSLIFEFLLFDCWLLVLTFELEVVCFLLAGFKEEEVPY